MAKDLKLSDLKDPKVCANTPNQMCFFCSRNCGQIYSFRELFTEETQENVDKFNEMNKEGGQNG